MTSGLSAGPRGLGQTDGLPQPDAAALQHSLHVKDLIDQRIAREGPLDFAEFMQLALYAPGLGYYMAGAQKFGAEGDFVTAPELGPLFSQALAVQLVEVIVHGVPARVLEFGAGSGTLAASMLPELDRRLPTGTKAEYLILEPSAELQQRQQTHLQAVLDADAFARVSWLDSLPTNFSGVMVANEVIDAMPVSRFQKGGSLQQLAVDRHQETGPESSAADPSYFWTPTNACPEMVSAVTQLEASLGYVLPAGYASEINFLVGPWLETLSACMDQGVVLLIDYGYPEREYYLAERDSGTLSCYYQHRAHDQPFIYPGLQDITAHVDFTRVARSSIEAGFELLGYGAQANFLLANELSELARTTAALLNSEADRISLNRSVKTLTLPGEMGERFQVMALGKGYDRELRGFRLQDLSHRL